jgi:hypothetical protein
MAESKKKKPAKPAKKASRKPSATAAAAKSVKAAAKTKTAAKSAKLALKSAKWVKPAKTTRPAAEKTRPKRLFLSLAALTILIAGAIAANYSNSSESVPESSNTFDPAARQFSDEIIEHLRAGECQEIADKTSRGFQAVITEESWLQQCNLASSVLTGTADPTERVDSNTGDDITEFTYRIPATDDQTYLVTTQLVYRDDIWQLQGIDSRVAEPAGG